MINNPVPGSVKYVIADRVSNADMTGWLSDSAVKIVNGKISDVLPTSSLPSDVAETSEVLRLGDVSLMPGLVDAHCHMHCSATKDAQALALAEQNDIQRLTMRAVSAMRKAVLAGTTTVRDIGSRNEVAFAIKQAIKDGAIPGPRLLVAGTPITITAGHCWFFGTQADTADDVAKAVRNQVRQGADAIKIMSTGGMFTPTANPRLPQYPAETLAVAVREAARSGITVAAHCLSADGVKNCVEANVHNLIHARWYSQDSSKGFRVRFGHREAHGGPRAVGRPHDRAWHVRSRSDGSRRSATARDPLVRGRRTMCLMRRITKPLTRCTT